MVRVWIVCLFVIITSFIMICYVQGLWLSSSNFAPDSGATTPNSVDMANFSDKLYIAFSFHRPGGGVYNSLFYSSIAGGLPNGDILDLGGTPYSSTGPSVTSDGSYIYYGYIDSSKKPHIRHSSSGSEGSWTDGGTPTGTRYSTKDPHLVAYGGKVYFFFIDKDTNGIYYYSFAGSWNSNPVSFPALSGSVTPLGLSTTVYNGSIWLAVTGSDENIYIANITIGSEGSTTYTKKSYTNTNVRPELTAYGNVLYLAYIKDVGTSHSGPYNITLEYQIYPFMAKGGFFAKFDSVYVTANQAPGMTGWLGSSTGINNYGLQIAYVNLSTPYYTRWLDNDKDGYLTIGNIDCNDNSADINPGAAEICSGKKDENCDGAVDCEDSTCPCGSGKTCYQQACCTLKTCADYPGQVGDFSNGCGGTIHCAACTSGQTQTQSCGNCGTQTRTCASGSWGAWGSCTGEGCAPGAVQTCTGGTQTCQSDCTWGLCLAAGTPGTPCTCGPPGYQACPGVYATAPGNSGGTVCGILTSTCKWCTHQNCDYNLAHGRCEWTVCTADASPNCGVGDTAGCGWSYSPNTYCGSQTCSPTCQWGTCQVAPPNECLLSGQEIHTCTDNFGQTLSQHCAGYSNVGCRWEQATGSCASDCHSGTPCCYAEYYWGSEPNPWKYRFKSASSVCNSNAGTEYGCQGTGCGNQAGYWTKYQYCSGNNEGCTGSVSNAVWTTTSQCTSLQTCAATATGASCVSTSACDTNPPTCSLTPYTLNPTSNTRPYYSGSASDAETNINVNWAIRNGPGWSSWAYITGGSKSIPSFNFQPTLSPDGTWSIKIRVIDDGGNICEATDELIVDSTPPVTTDSYDKLVHGSTYTITLTCSDGAAGTGCNATYWCNSTCTYYGSTLVCPECTPSSQGNTVTLTCSGETCNYKVWYYSTDNVGKQESKKSTSNITLDTSLQCRMGALPAAVNSTSIMLSWSSTSEGVARYLVSSVGNVSEWTEKMFYGAANTSATYSGEDGLYYGFKCRADSSDKNGSWSDTVWTMVDTTPPQASLAIPESVPSEKFNVIWIGDDGNGSGIANYTVESSSNNETWSSWVITNKTSYNFTGQAGKNYYFRIKATDIAGNTGDWSYGWTRFVQINTTLIGMNTTVKAGEKLARVGQNITVNVSAYTSMDISDLYLTYKDANVEPTNITQTDAYHWGGLWQITPLEAGNDSMTITLADLIGNVENNIAFSVVGCFVSGSWSESMACGNSTGECTVGARMCGKDTLDWGNCSGVGPSPEVCDGKDNNCDGQTDEGLDCSCTSGETRSCGSYNYTYCQSGTQTCVNGKWGNCSGAATLSSEVCDGKDNDCNGQIDGRTDCCQLGAIEQFPTSWQYDSIGICKPGVKECVDGIWDTKSSYVEPTTDQAGIRTELADDCSDGLDNDCDGKTDGQDTDCGFLLPWGLSDYWWLFIIAGVAVLGVVLFLFFRFRGKGEELTWESLTKSWGS